ncbi:MAG: hypothetical protein COV55_04900 [Candidatus Komeilibacteria bacterium CG11_big_fil_rev_8_21_14_0_20_36_20]|uniref:Uncharacterized protein n=1 Tax=Candidatus Komeilibacteria bacterium CG11_big_fil_rev_8_21_14_0_20_36_20 TaxID=1974477 RepID=A0A2H0NAW2_9BACT|nr:MAG: hypothetical protein COV55_04900 [Candidatus Komeilibacteria bacterium CG11_big_fil_rev_8_21_14_0_20_36_20]PIR82039.1 MAG: hypothetical protein COU21_00135 [Candidatus Komeilibacteria bacterium CG10_big_fil_rev_8_21_14_0_10_36_65]PJC55018.1 MAG: hypothetical protein CO027_04120 [Candidatus Komeilibacteria bacterium CG_4_9_14_0_2_um_filter_36_13]
MVKVLKLVNEVKEEMTVKGFEQAVTERVNEMIIEAQTGCIGEKTHRFRGVEIVAKVITQKVLEEAACQIACGFGLSMESLETSAVRANIAVC